MSLRTARLTLALVAVITTASVAQAPPYPAYPPRGKVLVDDLWLPLAAVYGDSAYGGTPWPGGLVPYYFDNSVSAGNQVLVRKAMAELEAVAQVSFVPWSSQVAVLIVRVNPTGNNSSNSELGMLGVPQFLNIGINMFTNKYHVCHELFHTMGFIHEHQRLDRNNFVTVNWSAINQSACSGNPCNGNFFINTGAIMTGPYDFLSIMHYRRNTWSNIPGVDTLTCNAGYTQFQDQIGNRDFMTSQDAQGMAQRYGAPSGPSVTSISPTSATVNNVGFTMTVTGSGFLEGSPTGNGVQGSIVKWGVTSLETSYVIQNVLVAIVPAGIAQTTGIVAVAVANDTDAGGWSNSINFNVTAPPCPTASDRKGRGLAGIGDINGDGCDDYVVGSPGWSSNKGRAQCFSGKTGNVLWTTSGGTGYQVGFAVANAGDVSGDGVNDVLVSAPGFNSWQGIVRVVNGATGAVIRSSFGGAGSEYGWSVANVGDVDLDNIPDHAIGAPSGAGTGNVAIVSGASGGTFFVITSPQSGSRFGQAVAGGFDATGDGRPEVVVGAPGYNGPAGADTGAMFMYQGAFATLVTTRYGDAAYDRLGRSVALMPSTNGSALAYTVAGATDYGDLFGSGAGTGYVRIYRGWSLLSPFAAVATWFGSAVGDRYGESVAAAGDVDDDGYMDVLIGAIQDGVSGGAAIGPGYAEIRSGRTGSTLYTRSGQNTGDQYGWTVASAGDVDQDAMLDILVGAPFGDTPCPNAGMYELNKPVISPEQQKVMITEIHTGGFLSPGGGVELTNFGTRPAVLSYWKIRWKDGTTSESIPIVQTLQPGESMLATSGGASFNETPPSTIVTPVPPPISTITSDFGVALVNEAGVTVDEVHFAGLSSGTYGEGSLGGHFRGAVISNRPTGALQAPPLRAERTWGLDSNSGSDWTVDGSRSMGLESWSDGTPGVDPLPQRRVVINETDDSPDFIELRSRSSYAIDLQGWTILASNVQGNAHVRLRPFLNPTVIAPGAYMVIGDNSTSPSELPAGVPYVDLSVVGGGNIPFTSSEYSCALYDAHGRLVDLMRTTGHDDPVVHNHPRAPAAPWAFTGAAGRAIQGAGAIGRSSTSIDFDTGADFRAQPARTMGFANPIVFWPAWPGHERLLDVRANGTALGGGLTLILSGGPARAGEQWSFAFNWGHLQGQGPILGLGSDAVQNWAVWSAFPQWSGTLNARGAARVDFDPGTLTIGSIQMDTIFLLQNATGAITTYTNVIEIDL